MSPPLSTFFVPKAPVYSIHEDLCYPNPEKSSRDQVSMDDEQEAISHSSFEEYEYFEDHLDKILEQDPFSAMSAEEVGPAAQASVRSADTQKLSEALSDQHDEDSVWYCLAILDDETGSPLRAATDEETEVLAKFLDTSSLEESSSMSTCPAFHVASEEEDGPSTSTTSGSVSFSPRMADSAHGASSAFTSVSTVVATTHAVRHPMLPHKSGGPCDHCSATESPQWRRGPPGKPTLCNACGTRYRRTQQLGTVVPGQRSTKGGSLPGRKRKAATRDFALQQRVLKQKVEV